MNEKTVIKKLRRNSNEIDQNQEMLIKAQKGNHIAET
jgi:hypothetical protein